MLKQFLLLPFLFFLISASGQRIPIMYKSDFLSYLRHPNDERTIGDVLLRNKKLGLHFTFSFEKTTPNWHHPQKTIYGYLMDVAWDYAIADSASYYDSVVVFTGKKFEDKTEEAYVKRRVRPLVTIEEKLQAIGSFLYFPNTINVLQGDDKKTYYMEITLSTENCSLERKEWPTYTTILLWVIADYVLKRDATTYPVLVVKYTGKRNTLLSKVYLYTKEVIETLKPYESKQ